MIPFDFTDFTDTVRRYADEIEQLAQTQRTDIAERNREIDEGVSQGDQRSAAADGGARKGRRRLHS